MSGLVAVNRPVSSAYSLSQYTCLWNPKISFGFFVTFDFSPTILLWKFPNTQKSQILQWPPTHLPLESTLSIYLQLLYHMSTYLGTCLSIHPPLYLSLHLSLKPFLTPSHPSQQGFSTSARRTFGARSLLWGGLSCACEDTQPHPWPLPTGCQ